MKNSIAITLIICGTILIMTPHIYSIIGTSLTARTMIKLSSEHVSFASGVSKHFNILGVVIGISMVTIGSLGTLLKTRGE